VRIARPGCTVTGRHASLGSYAVVGMGPHLVAPEHTAAAGPARSRPSRATADAPPRVITPRSALAMQRLAGNRAVTDIVIQRDCTDVTRTLTYIYALVNDEGAVFYIGKTYQEPDTRKKQHDSSHPGRGLLHMKTIKKGDWTQFETQTWEQRYINEYASGGYTLDNAIYAITDKKFKDCVATNAASHPNYCKELEGKWSTWPDHV
jgi:hypothetical protein